MSARNTSNEDFWPRYASGNPSLRPDSVPSKFDDIVESWVGNFEPEPRKVPKPDKSPSKMPKPNKPNPGQTSELHLTNVRCCVLGCSSRGIKDSGITFHKFPKDDDQYMIKIFHPEGRIEKVRRLKIWNERLQTCGRDVLPWERVCSRHFAPSDFIPMFHTVRRSAHLKKNAIPSLNLPPKIRKCIYSIPQIVTQRSMLHDVVTECFHSRYPEAVASTQEQIISVIRSKRQQ